MSWLKAAIARISEILRLAIATLTQPAGHVRPEPTAPTGSKPTAPATPHPHPYALTVLSPSSGHAPSTTRARKRGSVKTTASEGQPQTAAGSKSQTPASRSRQLAEPAAKPAKKPAAKTKTAAKRTPAKAPAQTHTVSQSGVRGN